MLFTATYFRELIDAVDAAPECSWACWMLIFVWLVLTAVGCFVQTLLLQLEQTRLVNERRRLADDVVFGSAFSYDTFAQKPPSSTSSAPSVSRATFNFFEPSRLPENLQPLYPVISAAFEGLSGQFGFQASSVGNQTEHLLFLLGNVKSRPHTDAITRLHASVFGNYLEWTTFLRITPYCSHSTSSYASMSSASPAHARAASHLKLQEIALWLCIWGEGSAIHSTVVLLFLLLTSTTCRVIHPAHLPCVYCSFLVCSGVLTRWAATKSTRLSVRSCLSAHTASLLLCWCSRLSPPPARVSLLHLSPYGR